MQRSPSMLWSHACIAAVSLQVAAAWLECPPELSEVWLLGVGWSYWWAVLGTIDLLIAKKLSFSSWSQAHIKAVVSSFGVDHDRRGSNAARILLIEGGSSAGPGPSWEASRRASGWTWPATAGVAHPRLEERGMWALAEVQNDEPIYEPTSGFVGPGYCSGLRQWMLSLHCNSHAQIELPFSKIASFQGGSQAHEQEWITAFCTFFLE